MTPSTSRTAAAGCLDEISVSALRAHDTLAWERLDQFLKAALMGFAIHSGCTHADAEDLVQSSMVAFARAIESGRYDEMKGNVSGYLFGIARQELKRLRCRWQREKRSSQMSDTTDFWETIPVQQREKEIWEQTWAQARLESVLKELKLAFPSKFRVFESCFLDGAPAIDVAAAHNISVLMVYKYTYQIRQQIQKRLRKECIDAEPTSCH